jgi:FKBP-type peptidyl-prolyl cis-trans isomerase FkpA
MYRVIALFLTIIIFASCSGEEQKPEPVHFSKEEMIEMNKGWTIDENQSIENYMRRKRYDMKTTGTGIRYMIYQSADTTLPKAQVGDVVTITYEIHLVEGDSMVYSSEGETESFRVAMDYVENGLHEAMTFMREGEKAKFILPYHRAYGLAGDLDQIPPQAPLLYDIHLLKIEK